MYRQHSVIIVAHNPPPATREEKPDCSFAGGNNVKKRLAARLPVSLSARKQSLLSMFYNGLPGWRHSILGRSPTGGMKAKLDSARASASGMSDSPQ